jgi:hypothetical protein
VLLLLLLPYRQLFGGSFCYTYIRTVFRLNCLRMWRESCGVERGVGGGQIVFLNLTTRI